MGHRLAELLRFGSVGAVAFVVDVGLFNLLCFGPGGLLAGHAVAAKVVSVSVATVVAWVGNRHWTFAPRRGAEGSRPVGHELAGFALVNVLGMAVAVGCLAVSHHVLGLTSPVADNVAANVVGIGLGTLVRYLGYRRFVFTGRLPAPDPVAAGAAGPPVGAAEPR